MMFTPYKDQSCKNCLFAFPVNLLQNNSRTFVQCHKRAPTRAAVDPRVLWPEVPEDLWCGDWHVKEKEE